MKPSRLAAIFAAGVLLLGGAGLFARPAALTGIAAFYFLYYLVLIVLDSRLQASIEGPARATITSVSELGVAVGAIFFYAVWAAGELMLVAAICLVISMFMPAWLRDRPAQPAVDPGCSARSP